MTNTAFVLFSTCTLTFSRCALLVFNEDLPVFGTRLPFGNDGRVYCTPTYLRGEIFEPFIHVYIKMSVVRLYLF